MQIGIAHPALGSDDLRAACAAAARAGADGIEVHYASAGVATALRRDDHPAELTEAAAAGGVQIASLYLGCLCAEPALVGRPEIIQRSQDFVARALDVAARAGAGRVVLPFFGKNSIELDEEFTRACDALAELVEPAEAAGVVLAVESTLNIERMQFLLAGLGDTGDVSVCFNTGVALARKLDVAVGIRELGPRPISLVRFKDVRMAEGAPPDFHVALGQGNVDFHAVAQALLAVGYDGWVVVDPPPDGGADPLPVAASAIAFARGLLRPAHD